MTQGIRCCYFQRFRKPGRINHPAMITARHESIWQSIKKICTGLILFISPFNYVHRAGHSMIYFRKIYQSPAKCFPDGLVTQADTQDGFGRGILFYQWQQ